MVHKLIKNSTRKGENTSLDKNGTNFRFNPIKIKSCPRRLDTNETQPTTHSIILLLLVLQMISTNELSLGSTMKKCAHMYSRMKYNGN